MTVEVTRTRSLPQAPTSGAFVAQALPADIPIPVEGKTRTSGDGECQALIFILLMAAIGGGILLVGEPARGIATRPWPPTAWFISAIGVIGIVTTRTIIMSGAATIREREHGMMTTGWRCLSHRGAGVSVV